MRYLLFLFAAGALLITPKQGEAILDSDARVIPYFSFDTVQSVSSCKYIDGTGANCCLYEETFLIETYDILSASEILDSLNKHLHLHPFHTVENEIIWLDLLVENPHLDFFEEDGQYYLLDQQFLLVTSIANETKGFAGAVFLTIAL